MANACFDVDEAPRVMARLKAISPESDYEDIIGTHPSMEKRIAQLLFEKETEEILQIQKKCPNRTKREATYHYLSRFNYQQPLPKISSQHLKELMSK